MIKSAIVCGFALYLLGTLSSYGQTDVWISTSGVWSAPPLNWTPARPANDGSADVSFNVTGTFSSNVNTSWAVNSLTIGSNAGSFTLSRNGPATLTIGSSFTYSSANSALIDVGLLGTMSLNLFGSETLTLARIDSYTGATALTSGTLADAIANAFSQHTTLMVGSGSTLDVNFDESVSSLSDNSGGGTVVIASGATFTMNGSLSETFSGVISGAGGIQLDGANILTLTGANTYSGTTVIGSGSTIVAGNNSALGLSSVTLTGGAALNVMNGVTISNPLSFSGSANVLAGNGTFASPVSVDSTIVLLPSASPGNGPGNLTFSSPLTLATGGAIHFSIYDVNGVAGTGYSLITAGGGLALTASPNSITFNLVSIDSSGNPASAINFNSSNSYSWMFATSSSAITGFNPNQFNLITTGFSNPTNGGTFSFSESGNGLYLNFTPVPEPSTWAMMATGLFAVVPFAIHRRRVSKI